MVTISIQSMIQNHLNSVAPKICKYQLNEFVENVNNFDPNELGIHVTGSSISPIIKSNIIFLENFYSDFGNKLYRFIILKHMQVRK